MDEREYTSKDFEKFVFQQIEKSKYESAERNKRLITWSIGVVATLITSLTFFTSVNVYQRIKETVNETVNKNISTSAINEIFERAQMMAKEADNRLYQVRDQLQEIERRLTAAPISDASAISREFKSNVEDSLKRISKIEDYIRSIEEEGLSNKMDLIQKALKNDLEIALSVPLLRNDLSNLKESHSDELKRLNKSISDLDSKINIIMITIVTVLGGLLAVIIVPFFVSRFQRKTLEMSESVED